MNRDSEHLACCFDAYPRHQHGGAKGGAVRQGAPGAGAGAHRERPENGRWHQRACDSFVTEKVTLKSEFNKIERSLKSKGFEELIFRQVE